VSDCELCRQHGDVIASSGQWRVVLVDDAHYPGFCRVIWTEHVREMTDLEPAQRSELMNVVWQVEAAIREVMRPHKINLASLGNVVPHLHWHVIPRYADDMHFPNPIWGKVERSINAGLQERLTLLEQLKATIRQKTGAGKP
jgi:diadenosine tetraphosphate (Ap4A) HIT family hydrolase